MNANRIVLIALVTLLAISPFTHEAAAADKTVKVYILAGQSNMEGKGMATHLDTYKDDPLIKPYYSQLKDGDGWAKRDDVFITYPSKNRGAKHGPLTVGYGTKGETSIGPEFGFGHVVGDANDAPVLIIKTAWGGKSIHMPFRPPSAMPTDAELQQMVVETQKKYDETIAANKIKEKEGKKTRAPKPVPTVEQLKNEFGMYYRKMIEHVKEELATFESKFPELKGYKPEIAGFVWHQGFNDIIRADLKENKYADYTKWLSMLIKDVRKDLNAPDMPVVIGELSTGGIPSRGDFQVAQANVAKIPAFKGTVVFVPTAEYYDTVAHDYFKQGLWKGTEDEKAKWNTVGSDRPYHYLGSGKTFFLKGVAFGKAIAQLGKN